MKRNFFLTALLLCLALLLQPLYVPSVQGAPGDFLYLWGAHQHFSTPQGIARDKNGNIYVVDFGWDIGHVVQVFNNAGERLHKWGSFGSGDGQFDFPTGIAVDASGNVYVADSNNDRIQVFDSSGKFLRKWGSSGTGNGQFDFPVGLAFDSNGNLYVADANNNRVQVFDTAGKFIRKWGSAGSGDGQFNYDTGIAIDGAGHVYVVDSLNQRVQEFDTLGNFIRKWGSDGDGDGQFRSPWAIATDTTGKVYVTDTLTELVQVFDSTGKFLTKWGGMGSANGQFNGPYGVVAGGGEIFVVDQFNDRVQMFSPSGTFLRKWWSHDPGPGEMAGPIQTALDANENVYVADSANYRVDVFTGTGSFIRMWGLINGQNDEPTGIALDPKNQVYVVTPPDTSIQAYDATGTFLRQWFDGIQLRLAVDPSGNIWTIDAESSIVYVYDEQGNEIRHWGGFDDPNIGAPGSIAIDSGGLVYLADRANLRINIYDNLGNFQRQVGEGTLADIPEGAAVDATGNIYVVAGDFVYVFANSGSLRAKWGGFGDTNGLFIGPMAISVNRSGTKIFVSDTGNSRIQVFQGFGEQLPSGWSSSDIGSVGVAGRASNQNGIFTVQGSGSDIWASTDAFHYVYKALSGDGQIVARVLSVQNTSSYAKAGVMIRQSLAANSMHAMMDLRPTGGAEFSRRTTTGGTTSATTKSGVAAPYWVKLVRSGSTFTGSVSSDGKSWVQVGSTSIGMTGTVYVGLIVNSHNNAVLSTGSFDNVAVAGGGADVTPPTVTAFTIPALSSTLTVPITTLTATDDHGVTGYLVTESSSKPSAGASGWSATAPTCYTFAITGTKTLYAWAKDAAGNVSNSRSASVTVSVGGLPNPWLTQDIGSVGLIGSGSYLNGVFTLKGAGADIWGTADAFRFVYKVMTGDGQIIARVYSVQNTNSYAKGGVMMRQSLAANSMHAMMDLKPTGGAEFSHRTTTGGSTSATIKTGIAPPYWVKLVRSGNTFTGSVSSDGVTWTQVGSSTISMSSSIYVGLIVNSHNNSKLCTTTIDNVR